jgi:outer membrane murein-binding lipoprotein Lpp
MEAIEKVVEGISAEISSLKEQRHAAHAEAERADKRLKELNGRKAPLPSGTLSSEREGKEELLAAMEDLADVLNKESAVLSRTKAIAEEAAQALDRLILEPRLGTTKRRSR